MFVWRKITLFVWFVGKPVHFSGKGFDSYGIKILYREIYISQSEIKIYDM